MTTENRPMKIPGMLGFPQKASDLEEEANRIKPYSELSYRARYLLYPDEAQALLRKHDTHHAIDRELHLRFAAGGEYRERILGGYDEMERQMRADGRVSKEEADLVDSLNAEAEGDREHPDR